MDGTTQSLLALGVALLTGLFTSVFYGITPLFLNLSNWPSNLLLLGVPIVAFVLAFAYLNLSQVTEKKENQIPIERVAVLSVFPAAGSAIFVFAAFIIPFFSSLVTSAVPNFFELTPEQLILVSQTKPKDQLDIELSVRKTNQDLLDYSFAYGYYAFWGTLFGTMIALASR
jgi:hypothetical protein